MNDVDEQDFVSAEHDHLINAITKLDKTQHIRKPTRDAPTIVKSEFKLNKILNKDLNIVAGSLKDSAHHTKITKKIKRINLGQVLPKPLEKSQAERFKRTTRYDATKEKVAKWDPVVARNRTVDFVSFPLRSVSTRQYPTKIILSNLKSKSPLEKELDEIDGPRDVDEEKEEEQSFSVTYEKMLEHRKEMAKMRAQQSYKAAKAKRQSKIKSKKYHRILKKERLKQQLTEFEELQKNNPEEALKKLEELEKTRALERHTLRHRNTGKWAKSKLVRAKYDKETRQQLAEQLAVSKGLSKKTQDIESTDDEAEANENDVVPDITLAQDPLNPWMKKRSDKSNVDADFSFGYKKYLKDKMYKCKDDSDSDENDKVNDLVLLKQKISNLSNIQEYDNEPCINNIHAESNDVNNENIILDTVNTKINSLKDVKEQASIKKPTATSKWIVSIIESDVNNASGDNVAKVFDTFENEIAQKVNIKINMLRENIKRLETPSKNLNNAKTKSTLNKSAHNFESLEFKKKNPKPIIDEELIETNIREAENVPQKEIMPEKSLQFPSEQSAPQKYSHIDPNQFSEVEPKYLNTAISKGQNNFDELDDDDEQVVPKLDIEDAFEDDVQASFQQEKQNEISNDIPKETDLELPGWGSWGGKGVKATKRKKNRFITKSIPKIPRRDENKGNIIINELSVPQLKAHKVSELPFPFTKVSDFEASVRAPLGNTFIPETAYRKLIRPNVITKAGTIIEPMDDEQLLIKRNKTFKNQNILKLLGKQ